MRSFELLLVAVVVCLYHVYPERCDLPSTIHSTTTSMTWFPSALSVQNSWLYVDKREMEGIMFKPHTDDQPYYYLTRFDRTKHIFLLSMASGMALAGIVHPFVATREGLTGVARLRSVGKTMIQVGSTFGVLSAIMVAMSPHDEH